VSHLAERVEKDCLNCGATIQGRFCHICGQENIEPKESFWHLVTHFIYDITHFDGKFFSTLQLLLFKPGFLSHEYLKGRRASYLHPIRMYVFTSAFFFLIYFSFKNQDDIVKVNIKDPSASGLIKRLESTKQSLQDLREDSLSVLENFSIEKKVKRLDSAIALIKKDTTNKRNLAALEAENLQPFSFGKSDNDTTYQTVAAYDSVQLKLSAAKRDGFIKRKFKRQNIHLQEKYKGNSADIMKAVTEKFQHLFPQLLFVSLPFFALILQLLYRRKKSFYYVNHVVYTIHLYCATFILILVIMGSKSIFEVLHIKEPGIVSAVMALSVLFYFYKSLRNFYEQRRAKTVVKFSLILFLSGIMMTFLFVIFFLFSAMAI
jgi:Ca2+/Na+ antiporter